MPAPDHKALAISPYRAGFTSGQKDDETAKAAAMDSCQRALDTINSKARCELYAVGNTVVYARGRPPMPPEPWINRDPAIEQPFSTKDLPLINDNARANVENRYPQARASKATASGQEQPTSVFVVHGRSPKALAELEGYLSSVGVSAVVLSRLDDSPQSLFQKFWSVATQARFAIVLLSADDYGASREQFEAVNVGDRALQFRARQNVILELGFFYGSLGWENVFVLLQEPDEVFPNFELPSDLHGVVFDNISKTGWQNKLGAKLTAAKFKLISALYGSATDTSRGGGMSLR